MSKARAIAAAAIRKTIASLPRSYLQEVEVAARRGQGKGWGSGTVQQEARAALRLAGGATTDLIAFDIGANAGAWTAALLALAPGAQVVAFEPSAEAYRGLAARFEDAANVTLVNRGVGAHPGTAELFSDGPGSGLGSLTRRRLDHFGIDFEHVEEIEVVVLDEWCADAALWPAIVKIDVEGHELDVLRGASEAIDAARVVQFEFGGCNIDTRTFFQDFFYFFSGRGFALHRLGPKGLEPIPRYREVDESFQTTNYFAVRRGEPAER